MPKAPSGRPAGVPKPYLRPGSNLWQVKVKVPKGAGGPAQIARSLKTRDYAEALRRAPLVVADIRREIEARRRNPDGTRKDAKGPPTADDRKAAEWWAQVRVPAPDAPGRFVIPAKHASEWEAEIDRMLGEPVGEDEIGRERFEREREARTRDFIGLIDGSRVPVADSLERYLEQQGVWGSYASRSRLAVDRLTTWLRTEGVANNLHTITGRVADRFADALSDRGVATATVNSLVSALSAYWEWMRRRQVVETNPWHGQQRRIVSRDRNADKRPFTDDEIGRLLKGDADQTLADMMRIAALSGLRLNEIGLLKVADVSGGSFVVRDGKTPASNRSVPIHSGLKSIVDRRTAGKGKEEYLIEELTMPPSREGRRGGKVSERFTAYRRSLKLDNRQEGRRQSDTDFHSFRRWFITKAEQAGNAESTIRAVVGHKRDGVTLGVYSAGPSDQQKTTVVESVKLPA